MKNLNPIKIFGKDLIDNKAIDQLVTCMTEGSYGVLTADAHVGYAHPIGGAVAYRDKISLSGVGFDIACGNKAVRTDIRAMDLDVPRLMDEITKTISFGMGRINQEEVDHPVLEKIDKLELNTSRTHKNKLLQKARTQLGTVGSGNHFVDIFKDEEGWIWIGVHFGSRGFGHNLTTGFISISRGSSFEAHAVDGGMFSKPILFDLNSQVGQDYLHCLSVAGAYAYAGRDWVVDRILRILDNPGVTFEVHNHHNFAWQEQHFGESFWVVRKGCTPAFPGQQGFIGSNMFDTSVVVEGVDGEEAQSALYSTVHGAGRIMSRREAHGKYKFKSIGNKRRIKVQIRKGKVDFETTKKKAREKGIELRGGGADESPECYKKLTAVLNSHQNSIKILHRLTPVGVAMAGEDIYDPYRD